MNCLGCNLANKKEQVNVVFEDDYVCCFLDHNPYNEGHVLILPKKHIRYFDELDEYTANSLIKASMIISKAIKRVLVKEINIFACFTISIVGTLQLNLTK
ncbi:HIT family protein [Halalkalibacter flavus]|jgi:diadenosine tetraphosphate (Ap4A) HIT family hydrolase|uniref:HIT family protein n=1 Tax=Halalkalibacter flavus TaxID=3090668 RepID=UPI002FCA40AF